MRSLVLLIARVRPRTDMRLGPSISKLTGSSIGYNTADAPAGAVIFDAPDPAVLFVAKILDWDDSG